MDHLLPRSRFHEAVAETKENYVLSCSLCNGVKRDHVVLQATEDAVTMLMHKREVLIERARRYVVEQLVSADSDWNAAKEILSAMSDKR